MELDKSTKLECFTASTLVSKKPCWLYAIIGMGSATSLAAITLRDGSLVTSDVKMIVYTDVYFGAIVIFSEPVYFKEGLYLQLAANVSVVNIQFKEER